MKRLRLRRERERRFEAGSAQELKSKDHETIPTRRLEDPELSAELSHPNIKSKPTLVYCEHPAEVLYNARQWESSILEAKYSEDINWHTNTENIEGCRFRIFRAKIDITDEAIVGLGASIQHQAIQHSYRLVHVEWEYVSEDTAMAHRADVRQVMLEGIDEQLSEAPLPPVEELQTKMKQVEQEQDNAARLAEEYHDANVAAAARVRELMTELEQSETFMHRSCS